jgi:EF-P beta-lysylation protein EpmB
LDRSPQILTTKPEVVPTGLTRAVHIHESGDFVDWQQAMRNAVRSPHELRNLLDLPPADEATLEAEKSFPTFVSREFLSRIERGNPRDPLLLQVLGVAEETAAHDGFVEDPVGDQPATIAPGLIQKYARRALVIATGICGIHCRYCFRREFDYATATEDGFEPMLDELRQRPEVDEVILSGGDPLTLSDAKLHRLVTSLEAIPHVKRLRIHSRMPIVIPQRVTDALIRMLSQSRLACWMVIHCNHVNEIDDAVESAIGKCIDHGIPVLNQAVLLREVNDSLSALEALCRRLVDLRVQPYYLNQLDRVRGAAHFDVPESRGLELIEQLRSRLPGYAVPRYVIEVAGRSSKSPVVEL